MYNAAFPAMILSKENGGEIRTRNGKRTFIGAATLTGSIIASLMPAPKSRVKVICNALLIAMSTENFFLAFGKTLPLWCIGGVLGWLCIPLMNANMDVFVPRAYSCSDAGQSLCSKKYISVFYNSAWLYSWWISC